MSEPAEAAVRAWANARPDLVGNGQPVSGGFYLRQQRSPASGQYAVMARSSVASRPVVAEDGRIDQARISALFYGGTQETAEAAAAAYASAVQSLSGRPAPCPGTGLAILVSDNLSGPAYVAMPTEGGEEFAFEVAADFLLAPT